MTCLHSDELDEDTEGGQSSTSLRPSLVMRSSLGTACSAMSTRLSDLGALEDQQRESLKPDLDEVVDVALESLGYHARIDYMAKLDKNYEVDMEDPRIEHARKTAGSVNTFADTADGSGNRRLSVRDFAMSKLIGTRNRIKEQILKAANSRHRTLLLQDTVPVSFAFEEYNSDLFADVKRYSGIDPVEYANSFRNVTKEKFSEGASGAFLYFSSDEKYIVKTTSLADMESLLDVMPDYVKHLYANPDSLIVRYLGAHCVTLYEQKLYFVVMKNIFSQLHLSERYDLKGSWVNRHNLDADMGKKIRRRGEKETKCPLYRDNDLQHKINLLPAVATALHCQILRDSAFLSGKDYILQTKCDCFVICCEMEVCNLTSSLSHCGHFLCN